MGKPIGHYDIPNSPISQGAQGKGPIITRGKIKEAERIVMYGPEGVGKTTLASLFPHPIFIDIEGSTSEIECDRIKATSYEEVKSSCRMLCDDPQGYKTVIIDSVDWLEMKMAEWLCEENDWDSIEDPGYQKGFTQLGEEMFRFLSSMTDFADKGIHVVLIGHSAIQKMELPDQKGNYDFFTIDLHKKVLPAVKEWSKAIFFINWKTKLINDIDDKKGTKSKKKAVGSQDGYIYTSHSVAYDAKNRYNLPPEIPLGTLEEPTGYEAIAHIFESVQTVKENLTVQNDEPEEEESNEEISLLERCRIGEEALKEMKVKGFTTSHGFSVQRYNITDEKDLEAMTEEGLQKYYDHLKTIHNQIQGVTA